MICYTTSQKVTLVSSALRLNRGSETLSQNSANAMFSDSDITQAYKKKQGKRLPSALDQTIQKRKSPHFTTLKHKISSLFGSKGHIFHVYFKYLNKDPANKMIPVNVTNVTCRGCYHFRWSESLHHQKKSWFFVNNWDGCKTRDP